MYTQSHHWHGSSNPLPSPALPTTTPSTLITSPYGWKIRHLDHCTISMTSQCNKMPMTLHYPATQWYDVSQASCHDIISHHHNSMTSPYPLIWDTIHIDTCHWGWCDVREPEPTQTNQLGHPIQWSYICTPLTPHHTRTLLIPHTRRERGGESSCECVPMQATQGKHSVPEHMYVDTLTHSNTDICVKNLKETARQIVHCAQVYIRTYVYTCVYALERKHMHKHTDMHVCTSAHTHNML